MKNINAVSTVQFPVKDVAAAFVSPDFFKSMGMKASVTGEAGSKYKIGTMSGTILVHAKNKQLIRTLRFDTMDKTEPDAVSVFTYTAADDGKATVINAVLVNVPDALEAELKAKLKESFAAIKKYLTPPAKPSTPAAPAAQKKTPAKPGAKKAAATHPASADAPKPAKAVKAPAKKPAAPGTAKKPKIKE